MKHQQAWDYLKNKVAFQLSLERAANVALQGPEFKPNTTGNVEMLTLVQDEMSMMEQFFLVEKEVPHEERCPVTDNPFFSTAYHPTKGLVATYGIAEVGYLHTVPTESAEGETMHADIFLLDERAWDDNGMTYPKGETFRSNWSSWERNRKAGNEKS